MKSLRAAEQKREAEGRVERRRLVDRVAEDGVRSNGCNRNSPDAFDQRGFAQSRIDIVNLNTRWNGRPVDMLHHHCSSRNDAQLRITCSSSNGDLGRTSNLGSLSFDVAEEQDKAEMRLSCEMSNTPPRTVPGKSGNCG